MNNDIPRRSRTDLYTPAETAIRNAVLAVEEAGCHPVLTDAVNLLQRAKDLVADFVDFHAKEKRKREIIEIFARKMEAALRRDDEYFVSFYAMMAWHWALSLEQSQ